MSKKFHSSPSAWLVAATGLGRHAFVHFSSSLELLDAAGDIGAVFGKNIRRESPLSDYLHPEEVLKLSETIAHLGEVPGAETGLLLSDRNGQRLRWQLSQFDADSFVARIAPAPESAFEADTFLHLIDALPFGVVYVDRHLCCRFVNKAYERYFNQSKRTLPGKSIKEIAGEENYRQLEPVWERVLGGETVRQQESLTRADQKTRDFRVNYLPHEIDGKVNGFFVVIEDISDDSSMIEVLRAVHEAVNEPEASDSDTVQALLRIGARHLGMDIGLVSRIEGERYTVLWVEDQGGEISAGSEFELDQMYCSLAMDADDLVASRNAAGDDRFRDHPCYQEFELESYIGLPLRLKGHRWGTLSFSSPRPQPSRFNELDQELVRLLGDAVEHILVEQSRFSEMARETETMRNLAYTDPLTGAYSRRFMDRALAEIVAQRPEREGVYLAVVDLDFFKRVNDTYGHDAGDEVLRAVSELIGRRIRQRDLFGRIGGEEFVLLLRGLTGEQALETLDRLRKAIGELPIAYGDDVLNVTASVGVTDLRAEDEQKSLFRRADAALYEAKQQGRDRVITDFEEN